MAATSVLTVRVTLRTRRACRRRLHMRNSFPLHLCPRVGDTGYGGRRHSHAGHELERVGKSVLGVVEAGASAESVPVVSTGEAGSMGSPGAGSAPTISDRLRELAGLHAEGILDDAEFAAAKAKLLESL